MGPHDFDQLLQAVHLPGDSGVRTYRLRSVGGRDRVRISPYVAAKSPSAVGISRDLLPSVNMSTRAPYNAHPLARLCLRRCPSCRGLFFLKYRKCLSNALAVHQIVRSSD
ncbi:hypothetical protein TRAPUB_11253 [Trametes pubescens]|uniref:Uncharacterized protein n=1 Tax=Trametes pubescens TaxID=154538 RepID=A0A1M2VX62_TRAPU|nr:hypothetical protein TRAPUB_11253 [Trametes pubescens]